MYYIIIISLPKQFLIENKLVLDTRIEDYVKQNFSSCAAKVFVVTNWKETTQCL